MPNRLLRGVLTTGRRVLAVTALVGFAASGVLTASAASPVFNGISGSDYPTLQVAQPGAAWGTSTNAKVGDTVNFLVWDHNSVVDTTATNVTIKVNLPSALESTHTVTANLSADNAATVTGTSTVNVDTASHLTYVPGSAKFYRNVNGQLTEVNFPNGVTGDNVVTTGINVGSQDGCFEFAQAVLIQVHIEGGNPEIITNKRVGNGSQADYQIDTTANPGDTVNFKIFLQNNGKGVGTNTSIVDTLDSHLTYIPGSSIQYVKRNNSDFQIAIPDSYIKFNGQTLTWAFGDVQPVPEDAFYLTFQAKVAGNDAFPVGTTILKNTAVSSFTGVSATTNQVTITVTKNPTPVVSWSLRKEVMNTTHGDSQWYDTQLGSAAPGDTVAYRLVVTNTGNTPSDGNVVLKDLLPAGINFQSGSIKLYTTAHPEGVTINGNDLVNGSGLNIGSVANGNTQAATLMFTATLTSSCSGQQTLRNVGDLYYDNAKVAEDDATVIFTCTPGLHITKDVMDPADHKYKSTVTTTVHEGDIVTYRIEVQNSGNTTVNNPLLRDVLPKNETYVPNSLTIDGERMSNDTQKQFLATGIILTNLTPNMGKEIIFQVQIPPCPDQAGKTNLVNTAFVKADGVAEISDTATIPLEVRVAKLP